MGLHTEKPGTITTGLAGGAITKRRFIGYDDKVCSVHGALAKGVSREEDTDAGKSFAIALDGTVLVTAGAALTAGVKVTSSALGKAVPANKGDYINGIVVRDQPTVNQDVEVRIGGSIVSNDLLPTTTTTAMPTTTTTAG